MPANTSGVWICANSRRVQHKVALTDISPCVLTASLVTQTVGNIVRDPYPGLLLEGLSIQPWDDARLAGGTELNSYRTADNDHDRFEPCKDAGGAVQPIETGRVPTDLTE